MGGKTNSVKLGFTNDPYPAGTHMCMIYSSEEERKQTLSKFIDGGLSSGEKVSYFADEMEPQQVKDWLTELGVHLPDDPAGDVFCVSNAADVYHPTGLFDPDSMLASLELFYDSAMAANCPACRGTGEMSWALNNVPGSDRLMEYEAKLNDLLEQYPITALCQYDANKFDGATILDCLKVHPFMIVHGQVLKNPYYMKTEEFLQQLASR